MNTTMEKAYQILSSFSDEELNGFIMMFCNRTVAPQSETTETRISRKRAAAARIVAKRTVLPADFDDKQEFLDYLDKRYGA